MVYLDTSSLLKLIWPELDSELVAECVSRETLVLVSSLTELESGIQITAGYLRGIYSLPRSRRLHKELNNLLEKEPFERRVLSGGIFEVARIQHTRHGVTSFCRTLDRLHLAAMEELGLTRLMTNDLRQADAARALGFTVAVPA